MFLFAKKKLLMFCDILFLNPAKILRRLNFIPFCFITVFFVCWIDRLDLVNVKSSKV